MLAAFVKVQIENPAEVLAFTSLSIEPASFVTVEDPAFHTQPTLLPEGAEYVPHVASVSVSLDLSEVFHPSLHQ